MRLLHAVLLSVVIVLALDVGLLQARALDDDETDVSAGDVHPSRGTAIDEESRSLFPPSFTAYLKSFFGKMFSTSTYNLSKVRAQRRAARLQKANAKAARVEAARLANERAAVEKSMHFEIDKLVEKWKKAKRSQKQDDKSSPYDILQTKEFLEALKFMEKANMSRGPKDRFDMFELLHKKNVELAPLAKEAARKGGVRTTTAGGDLKAFSGKKQSEEAMPLSGGLELSQAAEKQLP